MFGISKSQAKGWVSDVKGALGNLKDFKNEVSNFSLPNFDNIKPQREVGSNGLTNSSARRDASSGSSNRSVKDPDGGMPQLSFMWEVSFNGMFAGDAERITLYAQSTGIPAIMAEPIKRRYAGVEYTLAGRDNSPKVFRVSVWDDQRMNAYHYFQKWINTINDPDTGAGVSPANYMRSVTLRLLDQSGQTAKVTSEFTFDMSFPIEINEVTLSYETSSLVTYDVMFSFSRRSSKGAAA